MIILETLMRENYLPHISDEMERGHFLKTILKSMVAILEVLWRTFCSIIIK